ncbi:MULTISPECIES: conjugal transfer protein TraG N-terminal domain-containing protein [Enterobacter]|uniref:conjugal transfer protein TraG N-terminal domain-containing protein n=1 Tax=Enterobacter TaxID=547 RepID=UPI001E35EBF0|nr:MULTISPECIES: conjugal transfer protein TraG N-terminal domain-containing protein [Enterobacter]MEA3785697.1 conjugal transfer protein TraG N-terminal domain-containing protein [Enterobacter quasihormaechei]MEA3870670.1 conjugal transfer protein TraG N-terminal domain-containing protein [Enterobacter quasihormaechei]
MTGITHGAGAFADGAGSQYPSSHTVFCLQPENGNYRTFAQFGLIFLSFWWELTRWLDTSLLELIYGNDMQNCIGMQNSGDSLLMQFVLGAMFIVLQMF